MVLLMAMTLLARATDIRALSLPPILRLACYISYVGG